MQVAKYFHQKRGVTVEWYKQKSGPDLSIQYDDKTFYVECYNFSKSFTVEVYMAELFREISSDIKVDHQSFLNFSLPKIPIELDE